MNYELIKKLYGVEKLTGCDNSDIEKLKNIYGSIPKELEGFYRQAAKTEQLNQVQDTWIFPGNIEKNKWIHKPPYSDYLILMNENQGVFQLVIKKEDLVKDNPPVYVFDESDNTLNICADMLTDFLMGMLLYQSVFYMPYSPEEFFWYSDEEADITKNSLNKLPYKLQNWYSDCIEFYSNASDNMLYIMSDDNQGTFGAMSKESYEKIYAVIGELGAS